MPILRLCVFAAVSAFALATGAINVGVANAGHTTVQGDCWQGGTPFVCREGWAGQNSYFVVDVIDYMSNASLHDMAGAAMNAWSVAAGPQSFYFRVGNPSTPTYVFLYVDSMLCQDCGTHIPYDRFGSNISNKAGAVQWSDIWVSPNMSSFARGQHAFAHELGHNLRLAHHGTVQESVMWPSVGPTYGGPTWVDIGGNPPCSGGGGTSYWGVRCIYNHAN